jgi:hypothetical protein
MAMNLLGISAICASSQMMSAVRLRRNAKKTAAAVLLALETTRSGAKEVPGPQPSARQGPRHPETRTRQVR